MPRRIALLLALLVSALALTRADAQNRTVTGRVFDRATNQGVAAATIQVVGGLQATQVNDQGQFRLNVPDTNVILNIRALGYRRTQVRVAVGQSTVEVGMEREAIQLNEVVVTGAATTQERRNVATAVSTVSAAEVSKVPSASLENALQGKVVGASIQMNSGAPGGGGQIQIRGPTSILGNGEPLYVVDGVIISNKAFSPGINAVSRASGSVAQSSQDNAVNRLADLNENDIESVQVLKSAAASAIYGSMATNGVVLITTKRGHQGAAQFNITQRLGTNQAMRLLGSRHWTQSELAGLLGDTTAGLVKTTPYCPAAQCPYYDYQKELYGQTGLSYETALTITGGTDATKYFVSGNDKGDPGTMLNTSARRQSLRLNIDQAFGGRWTANASASIFRSTNNRGISNNDNTFTSPIYAFGYTPAVVDLRQQVNGHPIDNVILASLFGTGSNPFQTISAIKDNEDVWRQLGSAQLRFNAYSSQAQSLTFSAVGGFDRFDDDGETYSPNYLQFEPDDGFPGTAVQAEALSRQYNGQLNAVHTFTPNDVRFLGWLTTLTTAGGLQYEDRDLNQYSVIARGLFPGVTNINQGTPTIDMTKTLVRNEALYASEEILGLNEKLSLSGRVRAERSSVNGDRNKFFYWPAVSGAYRFVNLFPHANEIKLRAAFGISGNQPNYGNRDLVLAPNGLIDGRNAIATPSTIGNPNIEPEKMHEQEYGMDASFFDDRAGFEASYYIRSITDLLLTAPLAPTTGFVNAIINGGEMSTKGVELAVNILPIRNPSFTWTSRTQFSTLKQRIVSLPATVADFVTSSSGFGAQYGRGRIARGYATTLIWGNLTHADGTVVDTVLADANPKFTMSFSNDFQFGSFSVSSLLDWRKGGFVSDMTNNLFDEGGNSWDYDKASPDPTKPLGAYRYDSWNAGRNAGAYIQDGSFVKLREITLSYRVPQTIASRFAHGHDLRLDVGGRNLYYWTKYWSFDPEVSNFGNQNIDRFVDLAPFPPYRSFFFGMNVGF
ncbi:MAG TPA: SusC/RagA family TonB-linked outer membrane protein [Gemmatimonadaceae bacterium]